MSSLAPVRPTLEDARRAAQALGMGEACKLAPVAGGHINESFYLRVSHGEWLLQWLNPYVFPRLQAVQANVQRVLTHLHVTDLDYGWPRLWEIPAERTSSGMLSLASGTWRALQWLPDRRVIARPDDAAQAAAGGAGFARLVTALRTLPGTALHDVLPGFHDLTQRLRELRTAASLAPARRLQSCRDLLRDTFALGEELDRAVPSTPACVIHGDTKFANLLFNAAGTQALAVDYDTVMAGRLAWDLGDMLRSIAAPEAQADSAAVELDEAGLQACAAGYAQGIGAWVRPGERAAMAQAPAYMACMLSARFLADHLQGNPYFRVSYPGHNLDRAHQQLQLAQLLLPFAGKLRRELRTA